ncbi:MAG TPA: hypothetical protein VHW91_02745 [Candidatus Dormibacteraeota bacterium]|nr:hypothetical protein [Candidatus Dormibacteraeota bacterium]
MVAPENDLSRVPGEANDSLRIRARAYSLSLSDDSLFLLVDDADGRRWADIFLGGTVDRRGDSDALTAVGRPRLSQGAGGPRLTVPLASCSWSAVQLVVDCFDEGFQACLEIEGQGDITDCRLFGGYFSGDVERGIGFYRSAQRFRTIFNPEPSELERRCAPADTPAAVDVVGTSLPGMRHWFFTPPPFCFGAALEPPTGEAGGLPDGPWLTIGLAALPGEQRFTSFGFDPVEDGFSLRLAYEGHQRVEGSWRSPAVTFLFGAADPYAGIRQYTQWLETLALVPPALQRIRPGWWRRPIFCGWGAQSHLGLLNQLPADRFATQQHYDDFLAHLTAQGLTPGTIIIDDRWQAAYGTGEVDRDKWPDLRAWIAARHGAGQRVLLWWKAWDPEGLDPDLTVRDASGRPVAADPSNPAYEQQLRETVRRLLGDDGFDADGFKIDFTARTPSGPRLVHHGHLWGVELLHRLLAIIYSESKRVKPDALIITHTPNPYFRAVTDMIRLNDVNTGQAVLPQMWHRARVAQAACPDLLIDSDNWQMPDRATWRSYLAVQGQIGVPSLYYATHVDLSRESFEEGDYAAIAEAWKAAESP